MQVARFAAALEREEVFRADLIGEHARDALNDPIAHRVAERVVVPLEAGDVDDPDAAPADALLDGEERFEPLERECIAIRVDRGQQQAGDAGLERGLADVEHRLVERLAADQLRDQRPDSGDQRGRAGLEEEDGREDHRCVE